MVLHEQIILSYLHIVCTEHLCLSMARRRSAREAVTCAERATAETLTSPDWTSIIDLCDIINNNPEQTMDAMKVIKNRLVSKKPKIQLLSLYVLEALSKNCGDIVHTQLIQHDILNEMVKLVKKRQPHVKVRERILVFIDTWQDAIGGDGGRYPQYQTAYKELKSAGVEFPPNRENRAINLVHPKIQNIRPQTAISNYDLTEFDSGSSQRDQTQDSCISPVNVTNGEENPVSVVPLVSLNCEDEETEEDLPPLLRRNARSTNTKNRDSYKKQVITEQDALFNIYGSERLLSHADRMPNSLPNLYFSNPSSSSSSHSPVSQLSTSRSLDIYRLNENYSDQAEIFGSLPPPQSRYNQRQRYSEQKKFLKQ